MEAITETCCGLDVHQATVVACLLTGKASEKPRKEVRTFRTVTHDLRLMSEWLRAAGCTHIAMESTGVYWKPVYAVLEDGFELVVGNAHHIKNVPGRKTDVKDSEGLAELMRHGLIRKSFVPPKPLRELRDLLRYRRKLVESGTSERNRLLAVLETANIKLASVASDVFGVSGRLMLDALIEGKATPKQMAKLAKGKLRDKLGELQLALEGSVGDHHRFLLAMQLRRLKGVEDELELLDQRIDEKLEPYRAQHELLMTIPGVSWYVAAVLIAEIGVDMTVFLSAYALAAWAGVCPGNNESAGKHKGAKARRGNIHLKTALVGAAVAAAKTKGAYLKDKYFGSRRDAAAYVLRSQSATRSSSPRITCSRRASRTRTSVTPTSTTSTEREPRTTSCAASNVLDSPSSSRPRNHRRARTHFRSRIAQAEILAS